MADLATMDATGQAELVRTGEASPAELVEAAIERIEALNPELNAVITPLFEKARAAAAGDLPDGPFRGVPLLLKDLLAHSAGDRFTEGLKVLKEIDWHEDDDQILVERYRAAGFVICGKTNCSELGILPTCEPESFGATKNPWDTGRSPGGSSGGSACAVAAGMVPAAHANDGGGSIRIPAAACGLVGLKPSRGRITMGREFGDLMTGLVAEHVVCRSVRDTAAILDATHGIAPGDPYAAPTPERPFLEEVGADPGKLRIGLMTAAPDSGGFQADPACVEAAEEAGRTLEGLGHGIEEAFPKALDDPEYVGAFIMRWTSGIAWDLDYWGRKIGRELTADDVEASTWELAQGARDVSAAQYLAALEYQQKVARRAADWWADGFDLLVTPTMGEPPTPLGAFEPPDPSNPGSAIVRAIPTAGFTAFFNSSGQPAISLPLHWTDGGLPIGVQLVADYGREDLLIRVAAQLEVAQPWAARTPPVFATVG